MKTVRYEGSSHRVLFKDHDPCSLSCQVKDHKDGFICTRSRGHSGPHEAGGYTCYAIWGTKEEMAEIMPKILAMQL